MLGGVLRFSRSINSYPESSFQGTDNAGARDMQRYSTSDLILLSFEQGLNVPVSHDLDTTLYPINRGVSRNIG